MTTPSATLRRRAEVDDAVDRLARIGLEPHRDVVEKSWDLALAVEAVTDRVPRDGRILDMGARWSPILAALEHLGYRDLWACDLERDLRDDLRRLVRRSRVRFSRVDLTATGFPGRTFHAVTCLSVIEHGVSIDAYLAEAARLLRPGGILVTSTDFWCEPVDTRDKYPYGPAFGEAHVFTPEEIGALVEMAGRHDLHLDGPLDLGCEDRVVTWERMGLRYTFTYLELRRG